MIGKTWFKNWLAKEDSLCESTEELTEQLAEQAKQLAYRELFRQHRFAGSDGLNEYDLDYSSYAERGDLIPVEMQQALVRMQQQEQEDEANPSTRLLAENEASEELETHDRTDSIA